MERVIGACVEVGKWVGESVREWVVGEIGLPFKNLIKLQQNVEILKEKIDELVAKESDVSARLQIAGMKRKLEEVNLWQQRVKKVKEDTETSLLPVENRNNIFSKFYSRLKRSNLVVKQIQQADRLLEKDFGDEDAIAVDVRSSAVTFDTAPLSGQSTTERTMDEIMDLLINKPEIGKIGVYGMGGIGKTTIMMNINNKLAASTNTQSFNRRIWVTVSNDMGSISAIQDKIALQLGGEFSDQLSRYNDKVIRASMLLNELKKIGKFLLILDDLWAKISLQEIGIPQPNSENSCKILVTARLLSVFDSLETDKNVEVKCLSNEEAWNLFVAKTGDDVQRVLRKEPDVKRVAEEVVRECGGLPLALITIGCAMRRKQDIWEWKHVLNELKNSSLIETENRVFEILRFSYANLTRQLQKCFLYCALFPEDFPIKPKKLIMNWIAEGYLDEERPMVPDHKGGWKHKMNQGLYLLQKLKDACMLETIEVGGTEYVRMHDLLRDLAIDIMRNESMFVTQVCSLEWAKASKISLLPRGDIILPDQLNCPNLSTLLLIRKLTPNYAQYIPPNFFSKMPALRVLDFAQLHLWGSIKLPASISDLVDLRALFLQGVRVGDEIPCLAKLKQLRMLNLKRTYIEKAPQGMEALVNLRYLNLSNIGIKEVCQGMVSYVYLEYLNLSYTGIQQLPQGMENLVNLRYLNFIGTPLKTFQVDVISKLTLLEDLHLQKCEFFAISSPVAATCIQEMSHLNRLAILSMSFFNYENYVEAIRSVRWNILNNFYIEVHPGRNTYRGVKFKLLNKKKIVNLYFNDNCSESSSFLLPHNTHVLILRNFTFSSISELKCLKNLKSLETLKLLDSALGDFLVIGSQMEPNMLASLEELKLDHLTGLKAFGEGALPNGCLANLKFLRVHTCHSLKSLFSSKILQRFRNIEVIIVDHCHEMKEIVGDLADGSVTTTNTRIDLPKLQKLVLQRLPELQSISREAWVCDSLKFLAIVDCPLIDQKLPFESFPALEQIYGRREWFEETLQHYDAETKTLLQNCFHGDYYS